MIPIRDDAPKSGTPFITWFLVGMNSLVFLFQILLPREQQLAFLYQFAVVPQFIQGAFNGSGPVSITAATLPLVTSMFLHGGWLHIIANMWALLIFGDNIEDHLGHFPYLGLYLVCGIAANVLQVAFNTSSPIPILGASGAIAGIMGAYFLLFPSARVLTIVPLVFMFVWLPAWIVLGYWFIAQFLSGAASTISAANSNAGGVAFWAHVGGFIAGVSLIKLFPARTPRYMFEE